MADWSKLPPELLDTIFLNLSVPDILRSTAVCSSWSAAVRDFRFRRHELRRQSPWLSVACAYRGGATKFFSFSEQRFYAIDRRLDGYLEGRRRICIGSSHGWLVIATVTAPWSSKLHMLNPITGAQIHLPPIDLALLSDTVRWRHFVRAVLSSNPSGGDYTVVLIQNECEHCLSFVRAGDEKWTKLSAATAAGRSHRLTDVIFHRGRFYTVTCNGTVEFWDPDGLPCSSSTVVVSEPEREMRKGWSAYFFSHLVEAPWGDLLQICQRYSPRKAAAHKRFFKVFKVDAERGRLLEVNDLAQHAVVLGYHYSLCLSTYDLPELSPNHIYFAFDSSGVYNLKDGRVSRILPFEHQLITLSSSTWLWVTPALV